jgi:ferrous iron transport protein A
LTLSPRRRTSKEKHSIAREDDMTDTVTAMGAARSTSPSEIREDQARRGPMPLGQANRGFCGRIEIIHVDADVHGRHAIEIESRLIELGFVEGAEIKILHEGPIGRDPIAVRINGTTIALRRREAMAILVTAS